MTSPERLYHRGKDNALTNVIEILDFYMGVYSFELGEENDQRRIFIRKVIKIRAP
jgi:hypothetical protein